MFAIGNDELRELPPLGDHITCPHCGARHPVEYGEKVLEDGTKIPDNMIAFYKCGAVCYLAGINGVNVMSRFK